MDSDQLLIDRFLDTHPDLAVDTIEKLATEEIAGLIENVSLAKGCIILSNMPSYRASKVLLKISNDQLKAILAQLPPSIAEAILRPLDKVSQKQMLGLLPQELAKPLKDYLTFNRKQVGAHIETGVLTLLDSQTIEKAIVEIMNGLGSAKPILFVLDAQRKLKGYVEANDLIAYDNDKLIKSIMKEADHPVIANMLIKDALENWDDSFAELPAVKADGQFLGVVSRRALSNLDGSQGAGGKLEVRTGNALGDLYLIGLTSLLGSPKS